MRVQGSGAAKHWPCTLADQFPGLSGKKIHKYLFLPRDVLLRDRTVSLVEPNKHSLRTRVDASDR